MSLIHNDVEVRVPTCLGLMIGIQLLTQKQTNAVASIETPVASMQKWAHALSTCGVLVATSTATSQ
jgi:hypothetical protein